MSGLASTSSLNAGSSLSAELTGPPQVTLALGATTSFKRSFDEFGFDMGDEGSDEQQESQNTAANAGRNKRARSIPPDASHTPSSSSSSSSGTLSTSSEGGPSAISISQTVTLPALHLEIQPSPLFGPGEFGTTTPSGGVIHVGVDETRVQRTRVLSPVSNPLVIGSPPLRPSSPSPDSFEESLATFQRSPPLIGHLFVPSPIGNSSGAVRTPSPMPQLQPYGEPSSSRSTRGTTTGPPTLPPIIPSITTLEETHPDADAQEETRWTPWPGSAPRLLFPSHIRSSSAAIASTSHSHAVISSGRLSGADPSWTWDPHAESTWQSFPLAQPGRAPSGPSADASSSDGRPQLPLNLPSWWVLDPNPVQGGLSSPDTILSLNNSITPTSAQRFATTSISRPRIPTLSSSSTRPAPPVLNLASGPVNDWDDWVHHRVRRISGSAGGGAEADDDEEAQVRSHLGLGPSSTPLQGRTSTSISSAAVRFSRTHGLEEETSSAVDSSTGATTRPRLPSRRWQVHRTVSAFEPPRLYGPVSPAASPSAEGYMFPPTVSDPSGLLNIDEPLLHYPRLPMYAESRPETGDTLRSSQSRPLPPTPTASRPLISSIIPSPENSNNANEMSPATGGRNVPSFASVYSNHSFPTRPVTEPRASPSYTTVAGSSGTRIPPSLSSTASYTHRATWSPPALLPLELPATTDNMNNWGVRLNERLGEASRPTTAHSRINRSGDINYRSSIDRMTHASNLMSESRNHESSSPGDSSPGRLNFPRLHHAERSSDDLRESFRLGRLASSVSSTQNYRRMMRERERDLGSARRDREREPSILPGESSSRTRGESLSSLRSLFDARRQEGGRLPSGQNPWAYDSGDESDEGQSLGGLGGLHSVLSRSTLGDLAAELERDAHSYDREVVSTSRRPPLRQATTSGSSTSLSRLIREEERRLSSSTVPTAPSPSAQISDFGWAMARQDDVFTRASQTLARHQQERNRHADLMASQEETIARLSEITAEQPSMRDRALRELNDELGAMVDRVAHVSPYIQDGLLSTVGRTRAGATDQLRAGEPSSSAADGRGAADRRHEPNPPSAGRRPDERTRPWSLSVLPDRTPTLGEAAGAMLDWPSPTEELNLDLFTNSHHNVHARSPPSRPSYSRLTSLASSAVPNARGTPPSFSSEPRRPLPRLPVFSGGTREDMPSPTPSPPPTTSSSVFRSHYRASDALRNAGRADPSRMWTLPSPSRSSSPIATFDPTGPFGPVNFASLERSLSLSSPARRVSEEPERSAAARRASALTNRERPASPSWQRYTRYSMSQRRAAATSNTSTSDRAEGETRLYPALDEMLDPITGGLRTPANVPQLPPPRLPGPLNLGRSDDSDRRQQSSGSDDVDMFDAETAHSAALPRWNWRNSLRAEPVAGATRFEARRTTSSNTAAEESDPGMDIDHPVLPQQPPVLPPLTFQGSGTRTPSSSRRPTLSVRPRSIRALASTSIASASSDIGSGTSRSQQHLHQELTRRLGASIRDFPMREPRSLVQSAFDTLESIHGSTNAESSTGPSSTSRRDPQRDRDRIRVLQNELRRNRERYHSQQAGGSSSGSGASAEPQAGRTMRWGDLIDESNGRRPLSRPSILSRRRRSPPPWTGLAQGGDWDSQDDEDSLANFEEAIDRAYRSTSTSERPLSTSIADDHVSIRAHQAALAEYLRRQEDVTHRQRHTLDGVGTGTGTGTGAGAGSEAPARDPPARRPLFGRSRPGSFGLSIGGSPVLGSTGGLARLRRNLGDYMPDELFDSSYENLVRLAATIGDVKSKGTPTHVIAALPAGFYKDFAAEASGTVESRCPICLDDYTTLDFCAKLECQHFFHKDCLQQWLEGARSCPVCRRHVRSKDKRRENGSGGGGPSSPGPSGHGGGAGPSRFGGGPGPSGFGGGPSSAGPSGISTGDGRSGSPSF